VELTRIAVVRNAILAHKSNAYCLAIAFAALLTATFTRFALADIAPHLTFVTYFPAILICSLLTGWRYGSACAVISGLIAEGLFREPGATGFPDPGALPGLILFMTSCAIIIATADTLRRAVRDLDLANRSAGTLNHELQHRVANMLTVVQALAAQSAKSASPEEFVAAFGGRLQALAKAHELLGQRNLETCTLPALIDEACQPFCAGENMIKSGPGCQLPSESCVPLVLALHELCTNALKYGALSNSEGRVEISWAFSDTPGRLTILWKELGGPVVRKPKRKGLGSALLRPQPGISDLELNFDSTGVCCEIRLDGAEPLAVADWDTARAVGLPRFATT
jgi:two-component sensor histidine kinase